MSYKIVGTRFFEQDQAYIKQAPIQSLFGLTQ